MDGDALVPADDGGSVQQPSAGALAGLGLITIALALAGRERAPGLRAP